MSYVEGERIGDRVGSLRRRRGLTQEQLAEASGVDLSTIRKLEQGKRNGARVDTLHALARALDVATSALFEARAPAPVTDGDDVRKLDLMPLRAVLTPAPGTTPSGTEPDLDHLAATLADAERWTREGAYGEALPLLPELVEGARAAGEDGGDILGRALHLTGWLLTQVRAFDLAYYPLAEAGQLTPESVPSMAWLLMRQGRFDEAERAATTTADAVEPKMSTATHRDLSTWVMLLLRATAAAGHNNRPDTARDILKLAHAGAQRIDPEQIEGPRPPYGVASRRLVALKGVENEVIAGSASKGLRMAERVPRRRGHVSLANHYRHRLDVAAALAQTRQHSDSIDVLREVHRNAPEWLPHQRHARHTMRTILDQRARPVTDDMRELADALGVE